jgi:hypothetical protein
MSVHESFWSYKNFRYLKAALALLFVVTVAYFLTSPQSGQNGGTVFGYTIGTLSAALIVLLAWFGIRKRSYLAGGAPLRGWLSAHVYLGVTLIALVPLHSGFQFGLNLHTLAYVLMCTVIVSGMIGAAIYNTVPRQMTENRPGEKLEAIIERISELDTECQGLAPELPDDVAQAVIRAVEHTPLTGSQWQQISGHYPDCGTTASLELAAATASDLEGKARAATLQLVDLLALKRTLVLRVRRDVRLKGLLDLWLIFHVPLSIATMAAVATHIVVVFYYH